jgi:hypothetical protein
MKNRHGRSPSKLGKSIGAKVSAVAAVLFLVTSCIVSDELSVITILADGSADWVRFQSNIRSTEKGEKGTEELRRFVDDFEVQKDHDLDRLRAAGGKVLESRWVRRQEPYSTVVTAQLPSSKALEEFLTIRGNQGDPAVQTRFTQDGSRRKLAVTVTFPEEKLPDLSSNDARRQEEADGFSRTRIAVLPGRILGSRGFKAAADGRSALLDIQEVESMLRAGRGKADLFLEWDIEGD